ncbi:MAG: hypothetical protein HY363_05730 [Candidatus Aenigmarchaeota archaeon]|nr:hypothetical protein [Candidatus Aenigmarchaeota archaeon]
MTPERKQELEQKLKDIQRIKRENRNIVTTKGAWEYLKGTEWYDFDEHSKQWSDAISSEVGQVVYAPTPERIVGVIDIFRRTAFYLKSAEENDGIKHLSEVLLTLLSVGITEGDFREKTEALQIFTPIFKQANTARVATDEEFCNFLIEQYIPSLVDDECKYYVDGIQNKLNVDTDFTMLYNTEKIQMKLINQFTHTHLRRGTDIHNIIDNILKARLDHHWEYRKLVLDRYVPERLNLKHFGESYDAKFLYASLVSEAGERLQSMQDRVNEFTEFESSGNEVKKLLFDSPESVKFIRFLLGAEKSYVMKLIRQYLNKTF